MPYPSSFPALDIPEDVDLWDLLFERDTRRFPGTKGKYYISSIPIPICSLPIILPNPKEEKDRGRRN
jgi:hypothetical protein